MDRKRMGAHLRDAAPDVGSLLARTVGLGLVAAGALVASLVIGRRQDRPDEATLAPPGGDVAPTAPSLDAIRAAGL